MNPSKFQVSAPLSPEVARRRRLVGQSLQLLQLWGYNEVEIPLLTPFDDIRACVDAAAARDLFRFVDRDGQMLALRGDVTPVVARQIAPFLRDKVGPVRVSYATRIARVHRAFAREQVEQYVVGVETIGAASVVADLEVLTVALDLLDDLRVPGVELHLGHVRVAGGLVEACSQDPAERAALLQAVAQRDPFEIRDLLATLNVVDARRDALAALCRFDPGDRAAACVADVAIDEVRAAAQELDQRVAALRELGYADNVHLDLTASDDRGYYTGVRFQFVSSEWGLRLGSGGRYDQLLHNFGHDLPAVGFSLRADRIAAALQTLDAQTPTAAPKKMSVNATDVVQGLRAVRDARRDGDAVLLVEEP